MTDEFRPPPVGWSTFGTHLDSPQHLLFSKEYDEGGLPLWEKPCPGCEVCEVLAGLAAHGPHRVTSVATSTMVPRVDTKDAAADRQYTRRQFMTYRAVIAGAPIFLAIEAVSTTALEHPEWDMDESMTWAQWEDLEGREK